MLISNPFFYYLLPLVFSIFFLFKWLSATPTAHKNLPPSPPKLPIIGNLHQLGLWPHRTIRSLAEKYGPLMLFHLGSVPVLFVSSAEAARDIMKTHDTVFSNRPKLTIAHKLMYNGKDVGFAPYGEYWRQMRSICVLQLLSNKRVQSFRAVREEEVALMIEKISQACSSSPSMVNLTALFVKLTNNVVCRVALGRTYGDGEQALRFKKLMGELVGLLGVFDIGGYIPWLAWVNNFNGLYARVDKCAKSLDEFLEGVVEEHMDLQARAKISGGRQDLVDILLEVQRDKTAGFTIDRESIKAIILDMFAAGTDTTFTALEWTMTEILRHPEVFKKMQEEVRNVAKGKQAISEDDLESLHYLRAVIKESLRLHPPNPLLTPRESTQDVTLLGYNIPKGTQVITNNWALGRDPLHWEDPEDYRPERFLNSSIDFKGHDFMLLPFGGGRRGCPGITFAMKVDELVLANVALKFDLSLPSGANDVEVLAEANGLTVHKKNPLMAVATPASC